MRADGINIPLLQFVIFRCDKFSAITLCRANKTVIWCSIKNLKRLIQVHVNWHREQVDLAASLSTQWCVGNYWRMEWAAIFNTFKFHWTVNHSSFLANQWTVLRTHSDHQVWKSTLRCSLNLRMSLFHRRGNLQGRITTPYSTRSLCMCLTCHCKLGPTFAQSWA